MSDRGTRRAAPIGVLRRLDLSTSTDAGAQSVMRHSVMRWRCES